jgi:hypothetical protein
MEDKLKFHLVPVSGTLKGKGGYRAEVKKDFRDRVVDFSGVLAETIRENRWNVDPELLRLYVRGILYSMLKNTAADGRTRKIDDFLSVSLNINGRFAEKSEGFDPSRHKLKLVLRPLLAFRSLAPKRNVIPVNVDHALPFRLTSITAADGNHKNRQVVFGQDIIVKGSNLTIDTAKGDFIVVHIFFRGREIASRPVETKIISKTDREIRIAWPGDVTADEVRGQRLNVDVLKVKDAHSYTLRNITAWIHFD